MNDSSPRRIVAPPPLDNAPKYGLHRHHSPRRYGCAHGECTGAASTLARAGDHEVAEGDSRTHNCCGDHPSSTADATGPVTNDDLPHTTQA